MVKSKQSYVLILASGGIDSSACIRYYKKLKFEVETLYVNYGQAAASMELKSIRKIARYYNLKLKVIQLKGIPKFKDGLIQGRNAFLLFTALLNFTKKNGTIALGIHSGTNYYDCSKEFVEQMQEIFDGYSQGTVKIGSPFVGFNKKEIFNYCLHEKVPIELTYSCELGQKKPCGYCNTCKDLKAIYDSQK